MDRFLYPISHYRAVITRRGIFVLIFVLVIHRTKGGTYKKQAEAVNCLVADYFKVLKYSCFITQCLILGQDKFNPIFSYHHVVQNSFSPANLK